MTIMVSSLRVTGGLILNILFSIAVFLLMIVYDLWLLVGGVIYVSIRMCNETHTENFKNGSIKKWTVMWNTVYRVYKKALTTILDV